ncbi:MULTISPECIES: hypothetical protein [Mycobacterium]|uniref:Uncharacterized protein n=2 Tax=Mycobacterium TaxID=1763 RepID=A0A1W9ZQF9_MYCAN|nr:MULTISPECIES: hypothetical protein [Mycobacterium]MCV7200327.1 hypothetical protein [Mycobacterium angelicum]ORA19756.1 hypothetical protein BST12_16275 [Mycobacterium angelicum]ORX18641.1 hypothetical protein AWC27_17515 [Mycobacterium szulgai]
MTANDVRRGIRISHCDSAVGAIDKAGEIVGEFVLMTPLDHPPTVTRSFSALSALGAGRAYALQYRC